MRFVIVFLLVGSFSQLLFAASLTERLREAASSEAQAEQLINTLQARSNPPLSSEDYLVLSESYQTLNNRDAALDAANKAERFAETPYLKALSLFHKAQIHGIYFQNAEMALQQLEAAEQLLTGTEEAASLLLLSDVLSSFASAYNLLGQLSQALFHADRSLQLAKRLNHPARELNALIISGRLALQNNQYQQAFHYLQQGLAVATTLQDTENLASIHFRLGMAYRKLDLHPEAMEHFQQAAERYRELNRHSNYAYALIYLAETYLEQPEQIDKAESLLQEAKRIAEQQQHVLRTAMVNYSLGRVALLRNELAQAEDNYKLALQQFRQINSATYIQESMLALVRLYFQQQRYQDAAQFLNEVAPTIDDAATYLQLRYHTSAASLAAATGDWQAAYHFQQRVTDLNQQELSSQLQEHMSQLKSGLQESAEEKQLQRYSAELQQQLAQAQSRQLMLQLLLVGLIFTAFVIWQLYRRQLPVAAVQTVDIVPRHWSQFQDKVKHHSQRKPITMLILVPRFRAQLQRQFGKKVVAELLQQVLAEMQLPELVAGYNGSEMLWLATDDKAQAATLLQQASQLLQQKLSALGAEPAVLGVELAVEELLGENWSKEELAALAELVWFGWHLAERDAPSVNQWHLAVHATHPRPVEWQIDDLRSDLLNACKLGELQFVLNARELTITLT